MNVTTPSSSADVDEILASLLPKPLPPRQDDHYIDTIIAPLGSEEVLDAACPSSSEAAG